MCLHEEHCHTCAASEALSHVCLRLKHCPTCACVRSTVTRVLRQKHCPTCACVRSTVPCVPASEALASVRVGREGRTSPLPFRVIQHSCSHAMYGTCETVFLMRESDNVWHMCDILRSGTAAATQWKAHAHVSKTLTHNLWHVRMRQKH